MEKQNAPYKAPEIASDEVLLKAAEQSSDTNFELAVVPAIESTKDSPSVSSHSDFAAKAPLTAIDSDLPITPGAPKAFKDIGPLRHNAVIAGCLSVAAIAFALNSFDLSSFIQREATLDKSGKLTYTPPRPKLPFGLRYDYPAPESEGLLKVALVDRTASKGFVDTTGKVIIEPRFNQLGTFHEGLARAADDTATGFIGKDGRFVIGEQFSHVGNFRNGVAVATVKHGEVLIDRQGKHISEVFETLYLQNGDVFVVAKNGKDGLLSNSGKYLIPPDYDKVIPLTGLNSVRGQTPGRYSKFVRPIQCFQIVSSGLAGVADRTGKILIRPQYESIDSYVNGFAVVRKGDSSEGIDPSGNRLGIAGDAELIDPSGKSLAQYSMMTNWDKLIAAKDKGKWIFLDEHGQKLPLPPVDAVQLGQNGHWFSNARAPIRVDGKWGFVNRQGEVVIKPQFEYVAGFESGFCPVWDGSAWRLIDKSGHYLPLPSFGSIERRSDGKYSVDVAGPLYQLGQGETVLAKRSIIAGLNSGLTAGESPNSIFERMVEVTDAHWNDYEGDY